jgi:hypothetical protein
MDCGILSTIREALSMGSELTMTQNNLLTGMQVQLRPLPMGVHTVWIVQVLTPDVPRWTPVCAGETPSLALSALCRMVGAIDRIPQANP